MQKDKVRRHSIRGKTSPSPTSEEYEEGGRHRESLRKNIYLCQLHPTIPGVQSTMFKTYPTHCKNTINLKDHNHKKKGTRSYSSKEYQLFLFRD